ncbi:MAG: single-stranded DNA-binding protein [Clostridia bacterium]|nr:single-stranded DNA-binding protein [Clostridia bacterium]
MNFEFDNNKVYLCGTIDTEPTFSHEIYGEGFYDTNLRVKRLSMQDDVIPITISERLIAEQNLVVGKSLALKGQFRSYNKLIEGKSKLMLTVFVREIVPEQDVVNTNVIELVGYICKEPIYRTTPFKREICDLLLAVNRAYNKSDYLPCIAWGRSARFISQVGVGEKLFITGRIQSREYQKKLDNGEVQTRVAYEVSIGRVSTKQEEDREQKQNLYDSIMPDNAPVAAQE